ERGRRCETTIPAEADSAVSGHCRDLAACRYFSDADVSAVGDVQIAFRIEGRRDRQYDLGVIGASAISAELTQTVAGDRRDDTVRRDLTDSHVSGVDDLKVAV